MKPKLKILRRKLLNKNFVFIDGIAKSGKIVLSSIISTFQNTENQSLKWRYNNIVKFNNLNLINENLAIDLILQDMQISMIENDLSRFLNFRKNDYTSVNNSSKKRIYYDNLNIKDNDFEINRIIKNLKKRKSIIPIVVDDFFPNCNGQLKYFFNFKKIIMLRSPISILYENLSRNKLSKQMKRHPWQIVFHYKKGGKKIPWFVPNDKVNLFYSSSLVEKYLMFMKTEYAPYLNKKILELKNIKFIFLDDIWIKPNLVVKVISNFLNTKKTIYTDNILKKLKLPRLNIDENFKNEYNYLKNKMNLSQFKKLLLLEKKYKLAKLKYGLLKNN